jgi:hypothetical protein
MAHLIEAYELCLRIFHLGNSGNKGCISPSYSVAHRPGQKDCERYNNPCNPPLLAFDDNEVLPKYRLEKVARPTGWCKLSIVTSVAMANYADFPHAQQPYQDWNNLPQSGHFLQTTSSRQLFPNANKDVSSLPHGSPQATFDSTCEINSRLENGHFWLVLTTDLI